MKQDETDMSNELKMKLTTTEIAKEKKIVKNKG